jgi:hypothetical protein
VSDLISDAERAVSDALMFREPHAALDALGCAENELVIACLSLARTLVTSAKLVLAGNMVSRSGFVQGSGSRIDTLCAEVSLRRELKGGER